MHGDKEAVDAILDHPDIAAVSFVGSTPIAALHLRDAAPRNGKRVQALGGAKNHMLVLPDADVDMAADAAVSAAYGAAGERCMAISVAVAVGDVGRPAGRRDRRPAAQAAHRRRHRPRHRHGPADHRASTATRSPATSTPGADAGRDRRRRRPRRPTCPADGFFLGTTLLDHVTPEMTVYTDEIFGPVLCVVRADDLRRGARR